MELIYMKKEFVQLLQNMIESAYNEDSEDEIIYYIDKKACESGDIAYMYYKNSDTLYKMKIIHAICSYKNDLYNELIKDEDVLIKGEEKYKADTSAEFITDTKNYLVWFREISVCI
jgi:hypothetical protein